MERDAQLGVLRAAAVRGSAETLGCAICITFSNYYKFILDRCSHICLHSVMREIIFYKTNSGKCPIEEYLDTLSSKQVEKIFFVLDLVEKMPIVPRNYFKKLESTNDIWEVRVQLGNNIFRLLGFFDGSELVILNHAFTKKTQKTPKKEIKTAENRKNDYFSNRRQK